MINGQKWQITIPFSISMVFTLSTYLCNTLEINIDLFLGKETLLVTDAVI